MSSFNGKSDDASEPISSTSPTINFLESILMKILVQRASKSHTILLYLRMKRGKAVSADQIFEFSPKRFQYLNLVHRSLDRLLTHGFANKQDNMYTITQHGIDYLSHIVATQPRYANE